MDSSPRSSFRASWLKIERARTHLEELHRVIATYISKRPVIAIVEESKEVPDWVKADFVLVEPVPEVLAAIVGDIVHNLRTSLDLLASDLVRLNGGDASDVYFPFAKSADKLDGMIKSKKFDRASPQAVQLLNSIRPYEGGHQALREAHDLDILDKHRQLIPFSAAIRCRGVGVHVNLDVLHLNRSVGGLHGPAASMKWSGLLAGTRVPIDFDLLFEGREGIPFTQQEVIPTVETLVISFSGIIEAFENLYEKGPALQKESGAES